MLDATKIRELLDRLPAGIKPLANGLDHIGLAVESLDASLALYRDLLGLPFLYEETVESDGVKVAVLDLGHGHLELLEPTGPDTPVGRFLARRGPGIHHIAIGVKDCSAALRTLRDAGLRVLDETPRRGAGGKQIAFVHPRDTGGVLLELCQPD